METFDTNDIIWKVLIYDNRSQDILSTLFKVFYLPKFDKKYNSLEISDRWIIPYTWISKISRINCWVLISYT